MYCFRIRDGTALAFLSCILTILPHPVRANNILSAKSCRRRGIPITTVSVTFDDYPSDISWDITEQTNGDTSSSPDAIVCKSDDYTDTAARSTISQDCCLDSTSATATKNVRSNRKVDHYTFTLRDSFGDGLCCDHGNGAFKIEVDGLVVAAGTSTDDEFVTTFHVDAAIGVGGGDDDDDEGSDGYEPSMQPTSAPKLSAPTSKPSIGPKSLYQPTHSPSPTDQPSYHDDKEEDGRAYNKNDEQWMGIAVVTVIALLVASFCGCLCYFCCFGARHEPKIDDKVAHRKKHTPAASESRRPRLEVSGGNSIPPPIFLTPARTGTTPSDVPIASATPVSSESDESTSHVATARVLFCESPCMAAPGDAVSPTPSAPPYDDSPLFDDAIAAIDAAEAGKAGAISPLASHLGHSPSSFGRVAATPKRAKKNRSDLPSRLLMPPDDALDTTISTVSFSPKTSAAPLSDASTVGIDSTAATAPSVDSRKRSERSSSRRSRSAKRAAKDRSTRSVPSSLAAHLRRCPPARRVGAIALWMKKHPNLVAILSPEDAGASIASIPFSLDQIEAAKDLVAGMSKYGAVITCKHVVRILKTCSPLVKVDIVRCMAPFVSDLVNEEAILAEFPSSYERAQVDRALNIRR